MAPRLTDYQKKRIIASYVETGTYRAAARACQVSVNTVRKLVQDDTEMLKKAEQKKADIGIAMGGVGSDIALDAADIALVDDEVKELPHLIALSRRMMITIKCNMSFSMGLNFVAIVLAIIGILNPVVGALVHNAGSVLVIINSALLLQWKQNK